MRNRWMVLVLPVLALLLAGGALVAQNLSGGTDAVTPVTVAQPNDGSAVTPESAKMMAEWQETGNVRGTPPTNPRNPRVHVIKP